MKSRYLLLPLSVVFILIIAGCTLDTSNCNQYENSIFNLYEKDSCWSQKAQETGDASWCNKQEGTNNYCVARVAHDKKDKSICGKYATDKDKCLENFADMEFNDKVNECKGKWGDFRKDRCLIELAIVEGKPSACSSAVDKVECFATVARRTGDMDVCDMAGADNKEKCIEFASSAVVDVPDETEETAGTEESPEEYEGECKYDDQCKPICEGNVKWKMVCNARTNKCEKGFEYDCGEQWDKVADAYEVRRVCSEGECVFNRRMVQGLWAKLSDDVKGYIATKQKLTDFMLELNKNCLNGLADVTNQLILDTAGMAGGLSGKLSGIAQEATMQIIDGLADSTPSGIKPEDFIAHNCNLYKRMPAELDALDRKIEKTQKQVEDIKFSLMMNQ